MIFYDILPLTVAGTGTPKTSVKLPRNSFHNAPAQLANGIATANGFARMEALFPCESVTGKPCSGWPFPSREGKAATEQVCRPVILSVEQVAKLLEAADELLAVCCDALDQYEGAPSAYGEGAIKKIVLGYLEASQGFRADAG